MAAMIRWWNQWVRVAPFVGPLTAAHASAHVGAPAVMPVHRKRARSGEWLVGRAPRMARPNVAARLRHAAAMAADILMVLLWAAMIPGFMWLGVAAGF